MFWKRKDESKEEGGDSSLVNKSAEAQRYLKVVFVGSRGSGTKTSFIEKYSGTNGYPAYKEMTWLGKRLILELWDDSDGSTTDADAIVFGYDITSRKSYNAAMDYRQPLIEKNPDAVRMVIGNKLDLAEKRTVSTNEGRILADVVHAACFHEVSALTGEHVDEAMTTLINAMLSGHLKERSSAQMTVKKFTDAMVMKVIFIGADRSGTKTSFINKYAKGMFLDTPPKRANLPELVEVRVNGININLSLIDVPNNEKSSVSSIKNVAAVVIGYDTTTRSTLDDAASLCAFANKVFPKATKMVLGGKADNVPTKCISPDEGRACLKSIGAKLFFEVSAKTGLNVHESMKALITSVIRNETDIRVVDIRGSRDNVSSAITASSSFTSVVEGEAADSSVPGVYDPLSEPGASFWKGYEAPNWLSKEAMLPRFMNVSDGIKVMFVGGPLTGTKSSFILSYAESVTFETHVSNVMFKKCKIPVNDKKKLDFVLWDTFINEYDPPASTLTNLTVGFVVGYDITNRESVDFVRTKLAGILKGCPSATIMVIGNKVDSDFNRQVSTEEGQALARELGASLFFETSARSGKCVEEAMEAFARVIYWKIKAANPDEDDNEDSDSTTTAAAAAATPSSSPPSSMFTSLFGKSKQKAKQNSFDLLQQQQKPVPRPPSQQQQQQQQQQASSSSSSSVTTTITTTGNSKPRLKIVFIGATATGAKTSFIHFYNRGEFLSNVCATAGAAFTMKETAVRGKDVIVEMWDIAGQERFFSVITMYLQNCDGVVIGYDIVSPWTYAIARKMCEIVSESFTTSKIMIIGNKVDLAETRSVTREQGQELAKTFCACAFYETSVKTGENVNESMDAFVDKILEGKGLL